MHAYTSIPDLNESRLGLTEYISGSHRLCNYLLHTTRIELVTQETHSYIVMHAVRQACYMSLLSHILSLIIRNRKGEINN